MSNQSQNKNPNKQSSRLVAALEVAALLALIAVSKVVHADPAPLAKIVEVEFTHLAPFTLVPCAELRAGLVDAATQGNLALSVELRFTYLSNGQAVQVRAVRRVADMTVEKRDQGTVTVQTAIDDVPEKDAGSPVVAELTLMIMDQDGQQAIHVFPTQSTIFKPETDDDPPAQTQP